MFINFVIVLVLLLGNASAQDSIQETLASLQGGSYNETQVYANKTHSIFKDKCRKNGGETAVANYEKAIKDMGECVKSLVDTKKLAEEMAASTPNGTLDEVFKRYCAKTPQFKACYTNMADDTKACFTTEEQDNIRIAYNVTGLLADFICYKEGDRITLFVAENGPECLQEKQENIRHCFNQTFGVDFQVNTNDLASVPDSLPNLAFDDAGCKQINSLRSCVVKSLEGCEAPTTANIVESMFKFIRESTPCHKFDKTTKKSTKPIQEAMKPDAASSIATSFAITLLAATAVLLA